MGKSKTRELAVLAVLTALSVVLAFIHLPTPTGYLTLLDAGIYFTAFYLGAKPGAIVGGLSAFLIDLLLGYPHYMFYSLIAHGLQGFFAGWAGRKRLPGLLLAVLAMVGSYFLSALLLGYGWGAALAGIWGNILQNIFGLSVGGFLFLAYIRLEK
ncbi:ECF transporter S component [Streptococcus chenjunshii]|uniref:ECF transporter S component n=1 Tax=Streptococcus chenjunshii TaxID=2173853 RepID=A0A372KL79_9STRE|nr:ECF transporter S component [Streptococcus chenjunshii]AXQ79316.1 ECF transporter S component [Streptococcus chenjunshii]RFU50896.1 ECF transporter S component [Streptococcus chenjunshii]RFU53042.1 ECF transporter S component [Streptococcus chenjunshii]